MTSAEESGSRLLRSIIFIVAAYNFYQGNILIGVLLLMLIQLISISTYTKAIYKGRIKK
jgi:hypothetical protein